MPRVINYPTVLETLASRGLRSLYHNSGSFGFANDVSTQVVGWVGPDDPTIRDTARTAITRRVEQPYGENLARMLVAAWKSLGDERLWIMPGSHWAYELDFGSATWMPATLHELGIDPAGLQSRNNGSAIEANAAEFAKVERFIAKLIDGLSGSSDFTIAIPTRPFVCLVHHHKQLWFQSTDPVTANMLR